METKIAVIGIVIDDYSKAENVNNILHEFGDYIIGRMGLSHKEKNVKIISIVIDAPVSVINALTGKLGMIPSVSAKASYSNK